MLFLPYIAFSQEENAANVFFLEVEKINCSTDVDDCVRSNNPKWDCQAGDLKTLINWTTFVSPLKIRTNDTVKLAQCISLKRSMNLPSYRKCEICVPAIELAMNCQILDTLMECDVWVLRTNNIHQLKPLVGDKIIEKYNPSPFLYALGVHDPPDVGICTFCTHTIIAKNGLLTQIVGIMENYSLHIIELEDPSVKSELFTFEISKPLLQSGNFEKIRDQLKENIGFDLYRAKRTIKVKYVKFL
jgi:hypothetical protein